MPRLSPLNNSGFAFDFGWSSASALRKDPPFATSGKGTASAVPPRANKEAGFSPPRASADYPGSHLKRIVIPNEVRDLQFAVEENHASSATRRNNSVSHLILGGAVLYLEENPKLDTPRNRSLEMRETGGNRLCWI